MQTINFNLTPQKVMELLGINHRQRLHQLRQEHLKEGTHYIKPNNNLCLYSKQAVKKLKEVRG